MVTNQEILHNPNRSSIFGADYNLKNRFIDNQIKIKRNGTIRSDLIMGGLEEQTRQRLSY